MVEPMTGGSPHEPETDDTMSVSHHSQLEAIPWHIRQDLVRARLNDAHATLASWHTREMYGAGPGSRIYQVIGEASAGAALTSWSFVIKTFAVEGAGFNASADTSAWDYWKREWLAYQAPWLQALDGSLVGPRRLGVGEDHGGSAWVAMEDLSRQDNRPWPLTRFRSVARCLGLFQAPYLTGRPLPTDPWLSRGWLRGYTDCSEPMVDQLPTLITHPLVRRMISDSMAEDLVHLWRDQSIVFDALAALPQTLCHNDFFPRNVFVRRTAQGGEQCVAIDWAYSGYGAIGEDLAGLVGTSLIWFEADGDQAQALETACLEGYVDGLHAGGWDGNVDDVLLGYLARTSLANGLGAIAPAITVATNEELHAVIEEAFGRPIEDVISNVGATLAFEQQRIHQLWSLLPNASTPSRESAPEPLWGS
jgi:hypothetical protein